MCYSVVYTCVNMRTMLSSTVKSLVLDMHFVITDLQYWATHSKAQEQIKNILGMMCFVTFMSFYLSFLICVSKTFNTRQYIQLHYDPSPKICIFVYYFMTTRTPYLFKIST